MKSCFMCGISEEKSLLYEGIHKLEGIIPICRKCYFKSKIPLIEKKEIDIKEIEKPRTVRERLMDLSKAPSQKEKEIQKKESPEDLQLKQLIEENYRKATTKNKGDLIDNFSWVIMRKRRIIKMTKEEFAKEIDEPLIVIENLEKGFLPQNYYTLIKKVENALGIRILKERDITPKDLLTETKAPTGLTISEIKEKKPFFFKREKEPLFKDEGEKELKKLPPENDEPFFDEETPFEQERTPFETIDEFPPTQNEKTPFPDKEFPFSDEFTKPKKEKKDPKEEKTLDELSSEEISNLIWGKK